MLKTNKPSLMPVSTTGPLGKPRAWTSQLWRGQGQRSRLHEAKDRFGGLAEASFSTPFGRVVFLVLFCLWFIMWLFWLLRLINILTYLFTYLLTYLLSWYIAICSLLCRSPDGRGVSGPGLGGLRERLAHTDRGFWEEFITTRGFTHIRTGGKNHQNGNSDFRLPVTHT